MAPNDELEGMWKEAVVVFLTVQSRNSSGGTEENYGSLNQESWCAFQYSTLAHLNYKPEDLPSEPA
jgi:hypothetical protein